MESVTLGIGILFVIVYSYERFNNPISNRSSTTAVRYHLGAVSYCIIYLTIFYFFNKYPELIKSLLDFVEAKPGVYEQYNKLPSALLVALLLTGFLQKIPAISQFDLRVRKFIQYLAAIPFEVRRLAKQLRSVDFKIDADVQGVVYMRLREDGLICDDINIDDQSESYQLWNKVSVLMYHLNRWEEKRKMSGYMATKSEEYKSLKNRYYRLSVMAKTHMNICCQKEREAAVDPAILELIKNFQEACRSLLSAQCEFISHGALRCIMTKQPRIVFLRNMGFQLPDTDADAGVTLNQMATLLIGLFAGLLIVMSLYGKLFEDGSQDVTRMIYLITLISTMNLVAVAAVIYSKGKWSFSDRDEKGGRPVFYYLLVSLAAVIISIPITLLFKTIIGIGTPISDAVGMGPPAPADLAVAFDKGWHDFIAMSYPWKLMIFTTTFCLAYQLDTKKIGTIKYSRMRWIEGLIQAFVALVTAFATYYWLINVSGVWEGRISLEAMLIRSAIIGFMIGCTITYWYKVVPKKIERDSETDEDFILGKFTKSTAQAA